MGNEILRTQSASRGPVGVLMQRMLLPFKHPQCFKILFEHHEGELLVAGMTPAIAVDAADQHFAVTVNFH